MKRKIIIMVIAIVAFLLALGITLYPIISTRYYEKHQAKLQLQYQQQVEQIDTDSLQQARQRADAYNKSIQPGSQTAGSFTKEALENAKAEYANLLNLTGNGVMGYVRAPNIGICLPILHGTVDATLERGVGHLLGSSLPIGGSGTHTILTAHSGMASAKMFSDLDQLQIGDIFYLDVLNETLAYQVDQIKVVLPHDTTYLGITQDADQATLITCTPFGVNTHRLLVRGCRIPYQEAVQVQAQQPKHAQPISTWEKQYLLGIGIGFAGSAVIVIFVIFWSQKRRKNEAS